MKPISIEETETKIYLKRYWILFLFSGLAFLCNFGFPQYVSMANVNTCYYKISNEALNWTVQMTMLFFILFEIPLSFGINYVGLRWTVIAGSLANTAASALDFAGLKPNGFPFVLLNTVFTSTSNILVNVLPPIVAAAWFPNNELSRACATGLFGMQLGFAAGYPFAPLIISNNCTDTASIEEGKFKVATILTTANVLWLILIVLRMMYGSFLAFTTVLNNLILRYFPEKEVEIGWMGTLLMVSGLAGSMLAGFILDFTHKFREITILACVMSLVAFILFASLLVLKQLWVTFLTISLLGFFQLSIVTLAIEYGIEVTYPVPEIVTSSLLCTTTNAFGLLLTEASSRLLNEFGQLPFLTAMSTVLLLSSIIPFFITSKYKRSLQNANQTLNEKITQENKSKILQHLS
nr:uncharacterized MFS-type transporter C09D4.1-like [Parasteatoda tepidariorum]